MGGKVTLKPPEGKESVIYISTRVKIQLPVSTPGLARRSRLLLRDHRAPAPAPAQVLVLMAMLVNSNGTAACTAATTTS